jgi:hypothetical protein
MKYIITEDQKQKLFDKIYQFIDTRMPKDLTLEFYYAGFIADDGEYDSVVAWDSEMESYFRIYLPEYWEDSKDRGTILELEYNIVFPLNKLFRDMWHEPMILWIKNNFNEISDIKIDRIA